MKEYTVKELYDKLEYLEEINRIIEESGLNECEIFSELKNIKKYMKIIKTYYKFGFYDKKIWTFSSSFVYNIDTYSDIRIYKEITNVGKLKEEEQLLRISFSTGAYTFGEYNRNYFNKFFKELQEVKPKYVDELNSSLYYDYSNAKKAYEHYEKTYKKYKEDYKNICKQNEIEELEERLKELKEE